MNASANTTLFTNNDTFASGRWFEPLHGTMWGWPGCPYPTTVPAQSSNGVAAVWIWRVVPIVLILVGTVGNILTVVVICRQPRKISSTAIYFLSLSITDTVFLYAETLPSWMLHLNGYNMRAVTNVGCKINTFLSFGSYHASAWILVAVTTERAFSIIYPYKVRRHCTKRSALFVVLSILSVISIINSHIIYGFGSPALVKYTGYDNCMPDKEWYSVFYHTCWTWIHFIIGFAAPFVAIITGNACVIRGLHRMRLRERQMENESVSRDIRKKFHHENHSQLLTIIIILLNVIFFISQTPLAVYMSTVTYMVEEVNEYACTNFNEYKDKAEQLLLYEAVTYAFAYINPSVNFILYVLSGTKFRNEIISLLTCKSVQTRQQNRISSRTTSYGSGTSKSSQHSDIRLFM